MNEKEKLVELIKQNGIYNGSSMGIEYYVVKPELLADTLIKNDIGDINKYKCEAEYWEKAYYEELSEYAVIAKSSAKIILNLQKECKIAEKALENESRYCEILTGMAKDEQDLNQLVQHRIANAKHQAEKEIEEEEIR